MQDKILVFKEHVKQLSANPAFVHHKWFAQWHLEIVERIATELLEHYPKADKDLVEVMVWLHDYGKLLDFKNQYAVTLTAGSQKLTELGFPPDFIERAIANIETMDKKLELDLHKANIEVQIVASADGCSHMVGPFMALWWYEHPEKSIDQLLLDNIAKLNKDWDRKIVLPEARVAFQQRHDFIREQSGNMPTSFLNP